MQRPTRVRAKVKKIANERSELAKETAARLFISAAFGTYTDGYDILSRTEMIAIIQSAGRPFAKWRAYRLAKRLRYTWP